MIVVDREVVGRFSESQRSELFDWMGEHGLRPDETRQIAVGIDEPVVEATVFVIDCQGRKRLRPGTVEPWVKERSVPMRVLPPACVRALGPAG